MAPLHYTLQTDQASTRHTQSLADSLQRMSSTAKASTRPFQSIEVSVLHLSVVNNYSLRSS